jgi:hypothetical protein
MQSRGSAANSVHLGGARLKRSLGERPGPNAIRVGLPCSLAVLVRRT